MLLKIKDEESDVIAWTVEYAIKVIAEFRPAQNKPFSLAISTGSSLMKVLAELASAYKEGKISFEHVVVFCTEEFVGIPRSHKESEHSRLWRCFIRHVDLQPQNVHILDGNANNLEEECAKFEEKIKAAGGLRLAIIDTGAYGEIARNEPGSSLDSATRIKTLASANEDLRIRFSGSQDMPETCLTMGVGTLMSSLEIIVLFCGIRKSHALEHCVERTVNHMYPVSVVQLHPKAMLVCDEDATMELRVATVKYFKGIEDTVAMEEWRRSKRT